MAYQPGDNIALELTTLNTNINKLRTDQNPGTVGIATAGYGYGSSAITVTPVSGDLIRAAEWAAYYQSVNQVALHQGVVNPLPATALVGDIAYAFPGLSTFINTLSTGRFNVASGNTTIAAQGAKLTDSRSAPWDGQIEHQYTSTFASWNHMRYFFNTGGQIRQSMTHVGGATAVDTALRVIESQLGTVAIDYNVFYNLTSTYSVVMTATSGSTTGTVSAKLNAAPGLAISIDVKLTLTSPSDGVIADGVTTSLVGERRSSGIFDIASPAYATSLSLTSGGGVIGPITAVSVSGGGNKVCNYNPVSSPSGCYCEWTLSATVTGGSGSFNYYWVPYGPSVGDTNYQIISGNDSTSNTIVVRTITTTTDLPEYFLRCEVTDLAVGGSYGYENVSINGNSVATAPPFTAVNISGGGTKMCTYDPVEAPTGCHNEWTLIATPVGGSGTYTYSWITNNGSYLITAGASTDTVTIISTTNTVGTDLSATTAEVTVTDTILGTVHVGTVEIDSNVQEGSVFNSLALSVSGGTGDKICRWDYDASTYPTSCFVEWTINATPTGGTGPFVYDWTVNTAGYSIVFGSGTTSVVVRSTSGTTDMPALSVSCVATDTGVADSDPKTGSITVGSALRRPGPITAVTTIASGGNTYTCTSSGAPCVVNSTWSLLPVGGSGNVTFNVTEVTDPAGVVTGSIIGSLLQVSSSSTGF